MIRFWFCFPLLILLSRTSQGQVSGDLDTVFVKTTRIPLKANETGRNISIVQGRDIQKMVFTSLDDLFQYFPGIEVQSRNAFGAQGDITMRGSTYTQVLILIDGMKLNDPLTGHFNGYIPVTPAEIDRIEVLRGAASAMYGADAVGGVINIITKGSVDQRRESTEVIGQINYGEHRLVSAQQGFAVNKDRSYLGGGFSMNQSDGQFIPEQTIDDVTLEGYNNFFNLKTFGLAFAHRFENGWRIHARSAYDDRDFSARYFYTSSTFDKSVETTRNWWNQLSLAKTASRSTTDFNFAYRNGTDQFVFSPDFPSTNLHTTQFWNFNFNHLLLLSERLSLQFGGQLDRRTIESTDRGDHQDNHFGIYAMGALRPISNLSLTGSLRLDYDQNYNFEVTPQLNVSYLLQGLTVRASVGRSIRAADYTERYVSFNLQDLTPGRSLGNPELSAEQAWSEEVGVDYQLTKNWQLRTTAFFRQSSNLIDYVPTNESDIPNNQNLQSGASYFYASNITDVQTRGLEFESWLHHSLDNKTKIHWSLGYTYLKTTNEEDVISVYISSHARHLLSTNFILETGNLELAINGRFKERDERQAAAINARLRPQYHVWNTRLSYRLTPQFSLNVQIHNLFDEDYQDILGAQMPSRWFMAGMKFVL